MKIPDSCPFCDGRLKVTEFRCVNCGSTVKGEFNRRVRGVSEDEWEFIKLFMRVKGNLKKVGEILNLSYPTVRSRLEEVRTSLGFEKEEETGDVISKLEMGKIDVEEALKELEEKGGI